MVGSSSQYTAGGRGSAAVPAFPENRWKFSRRLAALRGRALFLGPQGTPGSSKAIVETLHCEALFELRKKCTTVTTVSVFTRGSFDLFVPICIQHFPSPRIPPSCLRRGRGQEDVRGDEPGHRLSGHLQDAHAIGCVAHIRLDTHHEVEADENQGA